MEPFSLSYANLYSFSSYHNQPCYHAFAPLSLPHILRTISNPSGVASRQSPSLTLWLVRQWSPPSIHLAALSNAEAGHSDGGWHNVDDSKMETNLQQFLKHIEWEVLLLPVGLGAVVVALATRQKQMLFFSFAFLLSLLAYKAMTVRGGKLIVGTTAPLQSLTVIIHAIKALIASRRVVLIKAIAAIYSGIRMINVYVNHFVTDVISFLASNERSSAVGKEELNGVPLKGVLNFHMIQTQGGKSLKRDGLVPSDLVTQAGKLDMVLYEIRKCIYKLESTIEKGHRSLTLDEVIFNGLTEMLDLLKGLISNISSTRDLSHLQLAKAMRELEKPSVEALVSYSGQSFVSGGGQENGSEIPTASAGDFDIDRTINRKSQGKEGSNTSEQESITRREIGALQEARSGQVLSRIEGHDNGSLKFMDSLDEKVKACMETIGSGNRRNSYSKLGSDKKEGSNTSEQESITRREIGALQEARSGQALSKIEGNDNGSLKFMDSLDEKVKARVEPFGSGNQRNTYSKLGSDQKGGSNTSEQENITRRREIGALQEARSGQVLSKIEGQDIGSLKLVDSLDEKVKARVEPFGSGNQRNTYSTLGSDQKGGSNTSDRESITQREIGALQDTRSGQALSKIEGHDNGSLKLMDSLDEKAKACVEPFGSGSQRDTYSKLGSDQKDNSENEVGRSAQRETRHSVFKKEPRDMSSDNSSEQQNSGDSKQRSGTKRDEPFSSESTKQVNFTEPYQDKPMRRGLSSSKLDREFRNLMDEGEALFTKGKAGLCGKIKVGVAEAMLYKAADMFASAAAVDPSSMEAVGFWGNTLLVHGELKLKLSRELRTMLPSAGNPSFSQSKRGGRAEKEWTKEQSEEVAIRQTLQVVCEECEELFVEAGRKYRMALSINKNDIRALYNWGLALCSRAQLISEEGGQNAAEDADKVYLAAIDKFEAMMGISQRYAPGAMLNWGLALRDRSRLRPIGSQDRIKLLQQAKQLLQDAMQLHPNDAQIRGAFATCSVELIEVQESEKSESIRGQRLKLQNW